MKTSLTLAILFISLSIQAQTVLNGDFENNTASVDQINIVNSVYNSFMANSYAFGDYNGGGPNGGDMDIIRSATYCDFAPSGLWYVALTSGGTDAISLELSAPLTTGVSYMVTYFDRACPSISVGPPLKFGVSLQNDDLGTVVQIADAPFQNGIWTSHSFTFVAPLAGSYLTVTCDSVNDGFPWTQVDAITITETSSLNEFSLQQHLHLFPSIVAETLFIQNSGLGKPEKMEIFTVEGKKVLESGFADYIDVQSLSAGYYFIRISGKSDFFTGRFIKQ